MNERLFLYIDILGFSELVAAPKKKVKEIYTIIDELNLFSHDPYFKTIVFSDTILVYSNEVWINTKDKTGAVMWMSEFAQDLFYRLVGRDLHFRAILTCGEFEHQRLKNIDSFFGPALVNTYNYEKQIIEMGLFIDTRLVKYSDIFCTSPYDKKYHFVHIMQNLIRISFDEENYPIHGDVILSQGMENLHAYDFVYLKNIFDHMTDVNLDPRIRAKYFGTWELLRIRSAGLIAVLLRNNLDPRSIIDLDWSIPLQLVGTPDGFHG